MCSICKHSSMVALFHAVIFMSLTTLSAQVGFYPFQSYHPYNHIAPLLQSKPNNQNITHEHHISLKIPSISNDEIIFFKDLTHHFYIYRQETQEYQSTCILGTLDLENSSSCCIKIHENILPEKALELECFIANQHAECNPILLMYNNTTAKAQELDTFIEEFCNNNLPTQSFTTSDKIIHTIWCIANESINNYIQNLCSHFSAVYVADGHHRLAVAKNLHKKFPLHSPYKYVLAALASSSQLKLKAFHRIIKGITLAPIQTLNIIGEYFDITPLASSSYTPTELHDFSIFIDKIWYRLSLKQHVIDSLACTTLESLDSFIIQELIINPLQEKSNVKIEYIGGLHTYAELEDNCQEQSDIAIALAPVPMEQFIKTIDGGFLMPPKSTWFEPKLPPGIAVYSLM